MRGTRINTKKFRLRIAARGFLTIKDFAKHIGCSRPAIYFALENPGRYGRVTLKIKKALNG